MSGHPGHPWIRHWYIQGSGWAKRAGVWTPPLDLPLDEPEKVLVADGDGGKDDAIGVDDFDVDGLGVAGQVQHAVGHEPDEETARAQHQQQPDDAEHTHHSGVRGPRFESRR